MTFQQDVLSVRSARIILLVCISIASLAQNATYVPDVAHLVFSANRDGNWDLFLASPNGSSLEQLTRTAVDEFSPAISPDRSRLAYARSDGSLWTMALSSKTAAKLALPLGRYGHPTWLADGRGLVFSSYIVHPPEETSELCAYLFKEGKKKLFLKQNNAQDYPALSPDGRTLAYMSTLTTIIPGLESIVNQQLWVAHLDRGQAGPLWLHPGHDRQPAWSPDGKRLAFSSDRSGRPEIWVTDLEGNEAEQLTHDPAGATSPAWSPDGQEIVYVSTASGRSELMILNVLTQEARKISPFGARPVEVRDPQWR